MGARIEEGDSGWAERLQEDERAVARALTVIESRGPQAEALLRSLPPLDPALPILGITGPPGAGKSTLADQLAQFARDQRNKVAILAIDPSSPFSGGALLGDRVRMMRHHADPQVFIRSMASRGNLGGLAAAAFEAVLLFAAAKFDLILVETVGAGQDEVDIASLANATIVVLPPGQGDSVQVGKAGMMEIADVFAVNKADHPGAAELVSELRESMSHGRFDRPAPVIVETIATTGAGVPELLTAARAAAAAGVDPQALSRRWRLRLRQLYLDRLQDRLPPRAIEDAAVALANGSITLYQALDDLLAPSSPTPD